MNNQNSCQFPNRLVNQQPNYEKRPKESAVVRDRRLKIQRPNKKQIQPKWV